MKAKLMMLAMSIFAVTIASAQSPKSELLVGKWKIQNLTATFPTGFTVKQKSKGQKIVTDDEAEFKKTEFVFTKKTLSVGPKKFTWAMNADGTQVSVKKKNKEVIMATVVTLTEHELVFTRPDEGMIVTYKLNR